MKMYRNDLVINSEKARRMIDEWMDKIEKSWDHQAVARGPNQGQAGEMNMNKKNMSRRIFKNIFIYYFNVYLKTTLSKSLTEFSWDFINLKVYFIKITTIKVLSVPLFFFFFFILL